MLSVRVLQGFSRHAQWCVVTSGEHNSLALSISVLIRAPVRGCLWSEALAAVHGFLCHNIPHPFPFVLLHQHLFQCSYKLCWWSEAAAILGALESQQSLAFAQIINIKNQIAREEYTDVCYIYKIINTAECLQNSTPWSATESFMHVFTEAIQKSEW